MKKIAIGGLLTVLVATAAVLVVVPLAIEQSVAHPWVNLDPKEEGRAVLDAKIVLESDEGYPSVALRSDGEVGQLGEEDVEIKEVREFPFLPIPWVESKYKAVINPSKKANFFKPETTYTVTFGKEKTSFKTITLPKVTNALPCSPGISSGWGLVNLSTTMCVDLTFSEEVVWDERYFSISPAAKVKFDFLKRDDGQMSVAVLPDPRWENGVNYTLQVRKGLKDKFGHEMAEDYTLVFSTKPPPKVEEATPVGEAVPTDSFVQVKFDITNVDEPTVEESFEITPAVEGTFEWVEPGVLAWKPTKLAYSTKYAVEVSGKSTEGDTIVPYFWNFKTEDPPVFVEIQESTQNPTTLKAVASGGIGSYSYQWSTGETSEQILVDVSVGQVWNVSVTVFSGNQSGYAEIAVAGPPLPPPAPVVEGPASEPVIDEPAFRPPQVPTPGGGNKIVLTFDDSGYMSEILDILAQYDATAIFFPVGYWAVTVPDLIQRAIAEGHLVGNHTRDHADLSKLSPEGIREQVIGGAVGNSNLLRPPYGEGCWGADRAYVEPIVQELGYQLYCWTIDPRDWAGTPAWKIKEIVLGSAQPGAVVVLHLHSSETLVALQGWWEGTEWVPGIIQALQNAGYTVSW